MKKIFSLLLFLNALVGFTQKTKQPDYKKIEKEIAKEKSNYFFPKLIEKYNTGDTSMTLEEKRHLYYGYSFQKEYSPYDQSPYKDSLDNLLKKDILSKNEFILLDRYCDSIIDFFPFNIRALNYQLYACQELNLAEKMAKRIVQMGIIVEAIVSSGNGLETKSAFNVISVSHEYVLLNVLGLDFGGEQSLIEHYDYLTLAPNPMNIEGLYFDVSPCFNALNKMYQE